MSTLFLSPPAVLCCHSHDDGSVGCWLLGESCDGWKVDCSSGASQTDPNDEESWQCVDPANSLLAAATHPPEHVEQVRSLLARLDLLIEAVES